MTGRHLSKSRISRWLCPREPWTRSLGGTSVQVWIRRSHFSSRRPGSQTRPDDWCLAEELPFQTGKDRLRQKIHHSRNSRLRVSLNHEYMHRVQNYGSFAVLPVVRL